MIKPLILFVTLVGFLLATLFLSFLGIVRYRTYSLSGFAKTEQVFCTELNSRNLRPVFELPNSATSISYYIQPRMGRLFIKCSTNDSQVNSWCERNLIVFSSISKTLTIAWIEPQSSDTTYISISNGVTGEIQFTSCQFAYDKDSQTFYLWSYGLSH